MADMTSHFAPRTTLLASNIVPATTIIINMIFAKEILHYFITLGMPTVHVEDDLYIFTHVFNT